MSPFLPLVLAAWGDRLQSEAPWRLLALVALAFVLYRARSWAPGRANGLRAAFVGLLAAAAVAAAAARASVVDDAFIALRYAHNLLDGHGLVFNVGERVEGFTDLLWVLLVALGSRLSGAELPLVALGLNLAIVAANITVVAANARRLFGASGRRGFPLAAVLLAGHAVFLAHGTTGLETGLVALLVQLALYALSAPAADAAAPASDAEAPAAEAGAPENPVAGPLPAPAAFWGGVALVLAVLTRPDAALFLPIAALTVAVRARLATRAWGPVLRGLAALALPGVLLLAVQAWRVSYYGDWLPNTAYTKSAGGAYWSQGFVYLAEFWLGSASLPWALVGLGWAVRGGAPLPARLYVGLALVLQTLYVARVGGDFMSGRFFVVLLPLLALAAEGTWRDLDRRRSAVAAALAALLLAGLGSGSLVRAGSVRWYIADEGALYPVSAWFPVTIDHPSYRIGHAVGATLTARRITPTLAAGTIGMVGYYGRLPLVDLHGLTDRTVARSDSGARGHIGHEKMASREYLLSRDVQLVQSGTFCGDDTWWALRGVVPPTGPNKKKPWCFLRWDPELAALLRRDAPEWTVPDPEAWIDAYIAGIESRTPEEVAPTLAFLDEWYFSGVRDPVRRRALAAHSTHAVLGAGGEPPATPPTSP